MQDNIAKIYQDMHFHPYSWSMITSVPLIDTINPTYALRESDDDLHSWASEVDKGLQIHAARLASSVPLSPIERIMFSNFTAKQTHAVLQAYSLGQITDTHKTHIHELVNRSIELGHPTGSYDINSHLFSRASAQHDEPFKRHFITGEYSHHVSINEINKSIVDHRLPESVTVYSGIKNVPAKNSGQYHRIPGFAFTTLNRSSAIMYAKSHNRDGQDLHILQTHIPKDAVGLYVPQNVGISLFNANELIMPKDSILHVADTPTSIELNDGRNVHIWHSRRMPNLELHA